MPPQLTQRPAAEPADETTSPPFPYGDERTGFLPTATARRVLRSREPTGPIGTAGSTDCPACGSATVNGAGLFACTDCDWTGSLR